MDGDDRWWINLQYQPLNTVNEIPELELYSTGSCRPIRGCKQMSITGFYDALSVKTWTQRTVWTLFRRIVQYGTVRTQPRNLHDFSTYLYSCAVGTLGNRVFWTILCTGAFLYVRYSFLLISNRFCDLSLLHWPMFIWALNGTRLTARCHFPQKIDISRAQPTPTWPRNGFARIKSGYLIQSINSYYGMHRQKMP